MPLEIVSFVTGPVQTNNFLIADTETRQAVVIDPADEGNIIIAEAKRRGWQITQIWLTHAHFDHFGGASAVANAFSPAVPLAVHPDDLGLLHTGGEASYFNMYVDPAPEPSIFFSHGQILKVGQIEFEVRHAPGHTPGHVVFYCASANTLFSGDVIFQGSIGRTDLPGEDYETLINSIHTQVLSLPDSTKILPGHGPGSTVGIEKRTNPFIRIR
jgi:hydroxyacylglutathione hydrolase